MLVRKAGVVMFMRSALSLRVVQLLDQLLKFVSAAFLLPHVLYQLVKAYNTVVAGCTPLHHCCIVLATGAQNTHCILIMMLPYDWTPGDLFSHMQPENLLNGCFLAFSLSNQEESILSIKGP